MKRDDIADLIVFMCVADERSFSRAAAKLNTSQSAVSRTVRRLEESFGLRLLTRTTRNVAPTDAGQQLLATLRPSFGNIAARLDDLTEMRDAPAGNIRVNASKHAAMTILLPVADSLMRDYPDVHVEIAVDDRLANIVEGGFDAGVRIGDMVDKDMISVRIGRELRMIVVAAPSYLERRGIPVHPRDLTDHTCINIRLPTLGGLYIWEFEEGGRPLNVRVQGGFIANDMDLLLEVAMRGHGLACVLDGHAAEALADGRLVQVLAEWCPAFPGYHLYYPSRRQPSSAFRLFVDALRKNLSRG